jgi:hypothetical protein
MKHLILTGIAVLVLSLHSCNEYITEVDEHVTKEVAPFTHTLDITVYPENWRQASDVTGTYYYYECKEEKLTASVLNSGIMQAFYCYTEAGTKRYVLLPYEDYWANFSEYLTVEFSEGLITFLYKTNSGSNPPKMTYEFRVRFLW